MFIYINKSKRDRDTWRASRRGAKLGKSKTRERKEKLKGRKREGEREGK